MCFFFNLVINLLGFLVRITLKKNKRRSKIYIKSSPYEEEKNNAFVFNLSKIVKIISSFAEHA